MYIGVTSIEHHIVVGSGSIIGYNDSSWSLNYNGNKYHCSKGVVKYCDRSYKSGDLVSVFLDFDIGSIEFAINNERFGVAFDNLQGPVRAAVTMAYDGDSVKLVRTCGCLNLVE